MSHHDVAAPKVSPGAVLALCSGATFMAFLDLSVVNIAFPKIAEEFSGSSLATLTWVVSGYAVLFAAFLTPAGRLADTIGRAKVFRASLIGFTLASVACGLAPNAGTLVAARFVQGALAAGMIPAALGLILTTTPMQGLTKAIGTWSAVGGFSAVIGPVVGGVLVEQFDWRSVFLVNIPVGVLLLVLGARVLPKQAVPADRKLPDWIGTVALAGGIGLVVAALTEGDQWGWTSGRTLALLAGGILLAGFALVRSRSQVAPAIDISLWANRKFAVTNAVAFVFGIPMFAFLLAGPLLVTAIWHYSIISTAGMLTVGAVSAMIGSVVAGGQKPSAHRALLVVGSLMFAGCTAIMGSDLFGDTPRFWSVWLPTGVLGGVGIGFAVTALSAAAATALPPMRFAAGVGMNLTARQVGGAIGIALLAAIFSAKGGLGLDAFHTLYRVCAVISVVAAAVGVALVDRAPAPAVRQPTGAPVSSN
jgi:EmrB/QacA subfamily drug resistance transporter